MSDTPASFGAAIKNGKIQMMLGGTSFVAAAAVAAFFLQSAAPAAAVDTKDRAAIEAIVRDYILEHPEILPQAMEKLASKRMGAVIDQNRSVIETPYAGAWEGATKGDVVLVEFFDYACGYCRATLPEIAKLVAQDSNLKVVYRELPILSEQSADAAKVSLIDRKAAEAAMVSTKYNAEVESNIRLAQTLQASGTPTFVIGNQVLNGAVGFDTLKAAVATARGK